MGKNKIYRVLCYCLLGLVFVSLLWRYRYGFDQTDECYYYALAKRFCSGDRPVADEWNPTQFFSVLLCPFYMLYTFFVPSGEGIILAGRVVCGCLMFGVAIMIFEMMRGYRKMGVTAACLFMLCARQNIAGLSYYTLYAIFCMLAVLLYVYIKTHDVMPTGKRNGILILTGIFIGLATVCMPYLAVFDVLLAVYIAVRKAHKSWLYFFSGIMLVALAYIIFIFTGTTITELLANWPEVMSEPAHNISLAGKVVDTWLVLKTECLYGIPGVILLAWMILSRKRINKNILLLVMAGSLLIMFWAGPGRYMPGAVYTQLAFMGIPLLLIRSGQKCSYDLGKMVYCAGFVFALFFWIGSNTKATCLCTGLVISSVGVLYMLGVYDDGNEDRKRYRGVIEIALMILLVGTAAKVRLTGAVYRDGKIDTLDSQLTAGPAARIYTESGDAEQYNSVLSDLGSLEKKYPDMNMGIQYTKFLPWAYLTTDYRFATMTTWRTSFDDPRLETYEKLHPDKMPDIIVEFNDNIGQTNGLDGGEHMNADNEETGYLWNYMMKNGYICTQLTVADVYVLPKYNKQ